MRLIELTLKRKTIVMPRSQDLQSCDFNFILINLIFLAKILLLNLVTYQPPQTRTKKTFSCICTTYFETKALHVIKAIVIKQLFEYKLWDYFPINSFFDD